MTAVPTALTARQTVFAPLYGGGRADAVIQRITESISLGLLVDGEQLPSELDLAGQLGVSTVTLREALASLREQGLVETRRGRNGGSFVRSPATVATDHLHERLRRTGTARLRDGGDEHAAVAGTAARLAAARAGSENVARLLALVEQLEKASAATECRRIDSRFHIEVAVASHSERLTRREVALQAEVGDLLWLPVVGLDQHGVAKEHRAIADAIAEEDEELARRLAERHVEVNVRRLVEAHLALAEEPA